MRRPFSRSARDQARISRSSVISCMAGATRPGRLRAMPGDAGSLRERMLRPGIAPLAHFGGVQPHRLAHVLGQGRVALDELGDELVRSEEHTSELQSQSNLVCRLLLEKKKKEHTRSRSLICEHNE